MEEKLDLLGILKTKVIVFEGGDCCGKTTMLEKVKEALALKYGADKVGSFKFPVYNGLYGEYILNHLKTFDPSNKSNDEIRKAVLDFSSALYANKLAALTDFYFYCEKRDYVLVDRFTLSQYVYDLAWTMTYKNTFNYNDIDLFLKRANTVMEAYSLLIPNITTFVFTKNDRVELITKANADRRIDKYDTLKEYQQNVRELMEDSTHYSADIKVLGRKVYLIDCVSKLTDIELSMETEEGPANLPLVVDNFEEDEAKLIQDYKDHPENWMRVLERYTKEIVEYIVNEVE